MKATSTRGLNTRQRMVDTAQRLFHQQGIHATTIDQILAESNTGKSQFYHYFKNKEGLIHAVLTTFYSRLKTQNHVVSKRIESWMDLKQWFSFFIEYQRSIAFTKGCPVGTIGSDLTQDQELLRQDVRLIFEYTKGILADFFSLMIGRGELPAETNPNELADFCFTIMQGGLLVAKIKRESAPFENAVEHAMLYLQKIAKPPNI